MAGTSLPRFGDWDVNNPSSSERFSQIFDRAREERRTGIRAEPPAMAASDTERKKSTVKLKLKKWFCCVKPPQAES